MDTNVRTSPTDTTRERWYSLALWSIIGVLVLLSPAAFVVLGWFTEAYQDTEAASTVSHRLHEVAFGILFSLALAAAVTAKLGRRHSPAALAQLAIVVISLAVIVSLTVAWQPGLLLYLVPLAAVLALAPRSTPLGDGQIWWWPGWLTTIGAAPLLRELTSHVDRAMSGAQNHTTHWSAMAALAIVLVALGLIPTFRIRGYLLVTWSLGAAALVYGMACVAFPYDASSHRPQYAGFFVVWGLVWMALPLVDRQASDASNVVVVLGRILVVPLLVMASLFVMRLDTPPNVPHRPNPGQPALMAVDVDRQTCLDCHATGVGGAPIPPHPTEEVCVGECWEGRADCVGCHSIDPDLTGIPDLTALPFSDDGAGGAGPHAGGIALGSDQIDALQRMADR